MKSRLEELTDDVKAEERRSDLAPVRAVVDPRQSYAALQGEILAEMANALGRAERRVREAIETLETLDRGTPEWRAQRTHALEMRRQLSIHREALRLPPDPRFEETYPIPPAR